MKVMVICIVLGMRKTIPKVLARGVEDLEIIERVETI